MKSTTSILFMILVLLSGMGYTIYNYLHGSCSQGMLLFSLGLLGVALINLVQGLIRALRDK